MVNRNVNCMGKVTHLWVHIMLAAIDPCCPLLDLPWCRGGGPPVFLRESPSVMRSKTKTYLRFFFLLSYSDILTKFLLTSASQIYCSSALCTSWQVNILTRIVSKIRPSFCHPFWSPSGMSSGGENIQTAVSSHTVCWTLAPLWVLKKQFIKYTSCK